ncbi:MAG: T9SS type A sorting domain-containing protein, partial [Crocinitomicaceae bacterium]
EMKYDSQGRLWIGNDGGVFYSDDNGNTFRQANRGYNVTQYYGISASAHGDVIGGTQDNGTTMNFHDNHTYREHDELSGGDGFTCASSFMNRDVMFSTIYNGLIYRTGDRGFNVSPYGASNLSGCTPGDLMDGCGAFYTSIELYENPNDLNSTDFIEFRPKENLDQGTVIDVPSETSQQFMKYTLTEDVTFDDTLFANTNLTIEDSIVKDTSAGALLINLYNTPWSFVTGSAPITPGDVIDVNGTLIVVETISVQDHYFGTNVNEPGEVVDMGVNSILQSVSWDTLFVRDTYQSWLALGLGGGEGLWLTRNALRFSAQHDGFLKAGDGIVGSVSDMEFSKDGDHLFVGTTSGRLYRLSGLADKYSPNPQLGTANGNIVDSLISIDHPNTQTTFELIATFGGAPVLGINVDRDNSDLVVVALGGTGGSQKVRKSTDATGATPSFTGISSNLPLMPCLSVLMDREDPNAILVGTEFGLFRTENGGTSWEFVDAPFGKTAIFDLEQNWRSWDEGCFANGQMYIGTHGRGIWSTNEYLSDDLPKDNVIVELGISNLKLYPNPVISDVNVNFDVKEAGKGSVSVYDLTGKLIVDMQNISLNEGKNNIVLGLSDLSNGTYIVKLKTESDSQATKFIKQ